MLSDTYNAGSSWVPLRAKEDSYAVITGYAYNLPLYALYCIPLQHFVTSQSCRLLSGTLTVLYKRFLPLHSNPLLPLYSPNPVTLYLSFCRASSGIGLELARLLYADGFSLILISRFI